MTQPPAPGYVRLHEQGLLRERALALRALASPCRLCPRCCGVDRLRGEAGFCLAGNRARIAKAVAHTGEEPAISGTHGSGTIFFTHCNLRCCFCQNHQISQEHLGRDVSPEELAAMMLDLQQQGCHNISLVSGAHFLPDIVDALVLAAGSGLQLPLVYNSNGYESLPVLRLLEGIVDVYLPDAKYCSDIAARRYSSAPGYHRVNIIALHEMFRQAGCLEIDECGIAVRGLIVRHLVLPGCLDDTRRVLRSIRKNLGPFVPMSLMVQYTACFEAIGHPKLGRQLSAEEYREACTILKELGFSNGWLQQYCPEDRSFVPDFRCEDSWN